MSKPMIGLLLILAGVCYGSLAVEGVYDRTVGFLLKNGWLKMPPSQKIPRSLFGPKFQIIIYAAILIIIGLYILWNRNI